MSKRQNVRQQELRERLREMLLQAKNWVEKFGYNADFEVEQFLAEYRVFYAVGIYASQRYFNDFATNNVFSKHVSGKTFKVDYEEALRFGTLYKVEFPEPKAKTKS